MLVMPSVLTALWMTGPRAGWAGIPFTVILLCFFVVVAGYRENLSGCHEVWHRCGAHLFLQQRHPQLHDPQDGQVGSHFLGELHLELHQGSCAPGSWAPGAEAEASPTPHLHAGCCLAGGAREHWHSGAISPATKSAVSTFSIFVNLFIFFYNLDARMVGMSVVSERTEIIFIVTDHRMLIFHS